MSTVTVLTPRLPEVDKREVLRYAGVRGEGAEYTELINELCDKISPRLSPRACYTVLPVSVCRGLVTLGEISVSSSSLSELLSKCSRAIVFAATLGIEADRALLRLGAVSPSRQLMADALCTERIEALCDSLCLELSGEGMRLTRRYSPGYGDLPLELQREIFSILDCKRKIGLTLNESLLMSPSKSVTAILGVVG
ncbi:MAG: hypothetical protein IJE25_05855 [Clostridia bacterium]|nr:hypothetical protein [Clostridia bacterium]